MREIKNKRNQETPENNDQRLCSACNDEQKHPYGEELLLRRNPDSKLLDQFYFSWILLGFCREGTFLRDGFSDHHWESSLMRMRSEFKRYRKALKELIILQKYFV